MYKATLAGNPLDAVIDSFASHNFMAHKDVKRIGLNIEKVDDMEVELGNGSKTDIMGKCSAVLNMNGHLSNVTIYVIHMHDETENPLLILGRTWLKAHNPAIDWRSNKCTIIRQDGTQVTITAKRNSDRPASTTVFKMMSFRKLQKAIKSRNCELYAVQLTKKLVDSIREADCSPPFRELLSEFHDIFREDLPADLPPTRGMDFEINLKPGETPPVRPVIRLSTKELKELKKQLRNLLEKGLIRPSTSPYGAPVFFIKKKNGDLRMVCDYRALNKITIPDANPIPLINETLDQISGANIFSQIDLIWGYHQMRVKKEDCHKTAIRTRFGSFEWKVLCFGLRNAPAAFTRLLSNLLQELHGECMVLFLDDILIYSKSEKEHKHHLQRLFEILRKNKIYIRPSKCKFGASEVEYLGYTLNSEGISTQGRLVKAVTDWPTPKSVKDVQRFLGLSNFYRRFIKNYAAIVRPISDLIRKKSFSWNEEQTKAFESLKIALTTAPVLRHPKHECQFVLTTDASKHAVGATLEQDGHPVAFLSHRLSDTETRWDTGDQELLAVMIALREWTVYLRDRSFVLKTDHEPIRYLQSKPKLSGRQMRWLDELQSFDFKVEHIPGSKNKATDALSRCVNVSQFKSLRLQEKSLMNEIREAYHDDEWAQNLLAVLRDNQTFPNRKTELYVHKFVYEKSLLYWIGSRSKRVYIPNVQSLRRKAIKSIHEPAHFATEKTYYASTRYFYWKGMYRDIERLYLRVVSVKGTKTIGPLDKVYYSHMKFQ